VAGHCIDIHSRQPLKDDFNEHDRDIGSGIGGPARYFANRFGCRVTGVDLTPEFCDLVPWP